ncbi:hypothetical protein RHSIM_Rhsim07G0070200 [Rhododendron simsii]|uniref:Uncharacterized protein n=1 Tax=Rhododendron simsii TaxID=118357 RepID=A0A834GNR9_RHOSS|nr:hypothetical protein RHSIM_Rhsim07G0070200 [Rhododendron simsii]
MDAVYGGDKNEQRIKAKMARLMRRRRLMTQRNDPIMNQRFLEIEREARCLESAYLRLRRLRHAPSLVRNDRNSANAHVIPIGGQPVNMPLPTSNEPNSTGSQHESAMTDEATDVQQVSISQSTRIVKIGIYCSKWMFSVRANTIDLRNLIEEYLGIRSWQNRWRQRR